MIPQARWLTTIVFLFLGVKSCEAIDIRMISATTSDSTHVRFEYEVIAWPLASSNVPVRVYRSTDAALSPLTDSLIAEGVLSALTTGVHTQELAVPASGLALSPKLPHLFVIADPPSTGSPQGAIVESNEGNNTATFRKYSFAVILHGLTFYNGAPPWVGLMATALTQNGYDMVVPVDWSAVSREIRSGGPQEFGSALAADVLEQIGKLPLGPQDRVDVHWIGHSRGTVVVSQALLAWGAEAELPDALSGGWLKVTMLDPHPAKNRPTKLISVNWINPLGTLLAFGTVVFQAIANDPDISHPAGLVDESELYFQRGEWYTLSPTEVYFDYLANYWGEAPLAGFSADKTFNITQPRLSHFEVPNFYIDVVLSAGQSQLPQLNPVRKSAK